MVAMSEPKTSVRACAYRELNRCRRLAGQPVLTPLELNRLSVWQIMQLTWEAERMVPQTGRLFGDR